MPEFAAASTADASAVWEPVGVLDPAATLSPLKHGPRDPSLRLVPDGAWRAVRLPQGEASVRLTWLRGPEREFTREPSPLDRRSGGTTRGALLDPSRGDRVRIEAWGPGAQAALAAAPDWLGADDDWTGFDESAFRATLPESVVSTRRARPGLRLPSGGSLFDTLCAVVLEQRVTGLEAHYAWARLVTRHGTRAPGPAPATSTTAGRDTGLWLPPTPEAWRRIPSWEWHQARVDAQRRNTIVAAAARASALSRFESAEISAADAALGSLQGVGVWSVAETLQRTHGAPDHVSFGDFHVAHFVGQALVGRRVDDAGMQRLLAPWAGQRQRVVRLLAASGAKNPSYGPRLAPEDHRRR